MSERALTVKDVAAELGVTPQRVYGWIKDGHIRPIRLPGGGPYRFRRSDLNEFEARCRGENSIDRTIVYEDEEGGSISTGPTNLVDIHDPFQRGRQTVPKPRDGGTNG